MPSREWQPTVLGVGAAFALMLFALFYFGCDADDQARLKGSSRNLESTSLAPQRHAQEADLQAALENGDESEPLATASYHPLEIGEKDDQGRFRFAMIALDEFFAPVPSARVNLKCSVVESMNNSRSSLRIGERSEENGLTDEEGRFRSSMTSTNFLASVHHPTKGSSDNIAVREPGGELLVFLRNPVAISGRVLDQAGQAVHGADINFNPGSTGNLADRSRTEGVVPEATQSDEEGRFVAQVNPTSSFRIYAEIDGGQTASLKFDAAEFDERQEIVLQFPGRYGLSGRVEDARGEPVEDAEVFAICPGLTGYQPRHGRWLRHARSDADGRFSMELPAGGDFQVLATQGDLRQSRVVQVSLDAARSRRDLQLRFEPEGRIQVSVFDALGQPVAGATLKAELDLADGARTNDKSIRDRIVRRARTDSQGLAILDGLIANEAYRLSCWTGRETNRSYQRRPYFANGVPARFQLSAEECRSVTVRGRLRSKLNGEPQSGVTLQVWSLSDDFSPIPRTCETDADGHFDFPDLQAGGHFVIATKKRQRPVLFRDLGRLDQDLDLILESGPPGLLELELIDPSGNPLRYREVRVKAMAPLFLFGSTTKRADAEGRVVFDDLTPMSYEVFVEGTEEPLDVVETRTGEVTRKRIVREP